jgi:hypothetical protein
MSSRGLISLVMLGIVLFIAGFVGNWAQDSAAPWINLGEVQLGSTIHFDADARTYRVVTSGATRPAVEHTVCTIEFADGHSKRELGGSGGVNARDAWGVARVLEFKATAGATRLTCNDRYLKASTQGRFQVVAADGPVSKAILGAFMLGGLLLAGGGLGLFLAYRRERDPREP